MQKYRDICFIKRSCGFIAPVIIIAFIGGIALGAAGIAVFKDSGIGGFVKKQSAIVFNTAKDIFGLNNKVPVYEVDISHNEESQLFSEQSSSTHLAGDIGKNSVGSGVKDKANAELFDESAKNVLASGSEKRGDNRSGLGGVSDSGKDLSNSYVRRTQNSREDSARENRDSSRDNSDKKGDNEVPGGESSHSRPVGSKALCNFDISGYPNHKIIFNEVAWMGSLPRGGETKSQSSRREWIELKNISSDSVNMAGWQILGKDNGMGIIFDGKDNIGPGGFYLLERKNDSSVYGIPADKIYSGSLPNGGELMALYDGNCNLIDKIDAGSGWPAGNNSTKQTMERDCEANKCGWHTSKIQGGTPRSNNTEIKSLSSPPSANYYNINIVKMGSGSGRIYSDIRGIDCGSDCSAEYLKGLTVVFTAVPDSDSIFTGWAGSCLGEGECRVNVSGPASVYASFSAAPGNLGNNSESNSNQQVGKPGDNGIIISEIFYDPGGRGSGGDVGKEFIELYNREGKDENLDEWSIKRDGKSIGTIGSKKEDLTVIRAHSHFLIGMYKYSGSPDADIVRSASLPDSSATISIYNSDGKLVDSVSYNNSVETGQSYERVSPDSDKFAPQPNPTPESSAF